MNQRISSHLWAVLGIGVVVIAGLGLLLAFLGREPSAPALTISPITSPPPDDPVVASVDGHPLRYSFWMEAVLIDQVMSGLAGQPAPAPHDSTRTASPPHRYLEARPAISTAAAAAS